MEYAQALLESHSSDQIDKAIQNFERLLQQDPESPLAWRLLEPLMGKTNQMRKASYALAEYYLLLENYKEAKRQIEMAKKYPSANNKSYDIKIKDLDLLIEERLKEEKIN